MASHPPEISVVLATPDDFATIRETVACLRRQSIRDRIEVVLVCPAPAALAAEAGALEGFARVEVVACPAGATIGSANAAGVRRATAPVVALTEDHVCPEPGWAAALVAAHRAPHAAVGPVVCNANPETAVSRADFRIGYGPWAAPQVAGEREFLPGHNSSYKREILLACGDDLEAMLGSETVLHWKLREAGHGLWLEPGARIAHRNFSRWSTWLRVQFLGGRNFAAARAADWPAWRRAAFALGSPLIPFVRLWRLRAEGDRARGAIALGLLLDGAGQLAGYATGAGDAPARLARYEWHRDA